MPAETISLRAGLRARFTYWRDRSGAWAARHGQLAAGLHEFVVFGIKQAWACLFGGLMVALLIGTHVWYPADAPIARYDALTIAAVIIQVALLRLNNGHARQPAAARF